MRTAWILCFSVLVLAAAVRADEPTDLSPGTSAQPQSPHTVIDLPPIGTLRADLPIGPLPTDAPPSAVPTTRPPVMHREPYRGNARVQTLPYTHSAPYSPGARYGDPTTAPYTLLASPTNKLDHLRQAAEHLEAAGLKEEAARIRQMAEAEIKRQSQALLKEKEAQLKTLQAEVDKLRSAVGSQQQVIVQVQIYEIDSSKIRKLGIDLGHSPDNSALFESIFAGRAKSAEKSESRYRIVESNDAHLMAFAALEREGLVKLIASPCLITMSGRPARFVQGGEIQIPVSPSDSELKTEPRSIGTEVDIVPQVLADQRIRLELRIELSELVDEQKTDRNFPPRLNIRQIDTGVELKSGQILILGGMKQDRNTVTVNRSADAPATTTSSRTIETLFVIRPKLIDANDDVYDQPAQR